MNDPIKIALIVVATILISIGLWIYFSPYQSCVRAYPRPNGAVICARFVGGVIRR